MKKFFTSVLIIAFYVCLSQVNAQALYPVSIDEKISNSSHIVEGRVIDQQSFWNARHTMIYTTNKVEIYKVFKGVWQSATIEVMTIGGTVGVEGIDASDVLTLDKGNIGIFFCYPNSINLLSPATGNRLFDIYSSGQGYFNYDVAAKTASAPFVRYSSIENQLYRELVTKTGRQPVVVNSSFNISSQSKPQTPLAPVITSISPLNVNAGAFLDPANNLITINGSGFGAVPGDSSAVFFDDANDGSGGTPFKVLYNSPLVSSWSDNQIRIRVPSRAGSGNIQVRDASLATATSFDVLNINYAVLTREITNAGVTVVKEINLMNDNGSGGYTVLYSTGTGGGGIDLDAAPEKLTFQRALNTWKEVVGFNAIEGGTTTTQAIAADGENVILFDNSNTGTTPLAAGVLAICYSYSNSCLPISTYAVQKTEFDIVMRNDGVSTGTTNFTSGPCPPATSISQTDLETVILHELGHALNLAHINDSYQGTTLPNVNPGKLMNYAIVNGVSRRSFDYSAFAGALYCINPQSNLYGSCSLPNVEMAPLARTVVAWDECPVNFPTTTTPPGTIVNFDLVHATSNKDADPAYTEVNCAGTGTNVTNNAYYALKTDGDGGTLNIVVGGYATFPSNVQGDCAGAGVRLALYQANSCPAGQAFPSPLFCRTITRNGALAAMTGLAANTTYLIYLDGITNTKASFTLTLNGSVLPVTLVDFKGNLSSDKVNLSWKTSREINSKEFIVEKSFDGTAFNQFATIAAKGNSSTESRYGIVDTRPFSDYTFYRLKVMDKDGHFEYSQVVKIKTPKKPTVISRIFPNPTTGRINLEIVSDSRKTLVAEAFDFLGKKVASFNLAVEAGLNEKPLNVNTLAAGTYFLQVMDRAGNVLEKQKFIKN